MSHPNVARRTEAVVSFGGTDITDYIRPYLLSLGYTDNEEDETDDLQIQLQDRDGLWLKSWLNDAVQVAAQTEIIGEGTPYIVTAEIGLNVREEQGTGSKKLGVLTYGTVVHVTATENGWATIQYSGKKAYVSANYLKKGAGTVSVASGDTMGLQIQAVLLQKNQAGDGRDSILDCGSFTLDAIDASGPPATITIKATSLPYSAGIRQTEKSKAWEACTLSEIAREMARNAGMSCLYESHADPIYGRREQYKTSDIAFLSALCKDAGISLKATAGILVLFDQKQYDAKNPPIIITMGGGSYTKYKLNTGEADTRYSSCRVRYTDPKTKRLIEGLAYAEDYKEDKKNKQLEIAAKVMTAAEAKLLASKRLRLHNKFSRTASFTLPGNPALVAGVTVALKGWGLWDGAYMIQQAKHTVDTGGYTTQIKLRRTLEDY